jgi:hypothetical protein
VFTRRIDAVALPESRSNPLSRRLLDLMEEVWSDGAQHAAPLSNR